jgi:hypothetical protein
VRHDGAPALQAGARRALSHQRLGFVAGGGSTLRQSQRVRKF